MQEIPKDEYDYILNTLKTRVPNLDVYSPITDCMVILQWLVNEAMKARKDGQP